MALLGNNCRCALLSTSAVRITKMHTSSTEIINFLTKWLAMQSMAVFSDVLAYAWNYFQPQVGTAGHRSAGRGTIQWQLKRKGRKVLDQQLVYSSRGPGSRRGGDRKWMRTGRRPPLRVSPLSKVRFSQFVSSWESNKSLVKLSNVSQLFNTLSLCVSTGLGPVSLLCHTIAVDLFNIY